MRWILALVALVVAGEGGSGVHQKLRVVNDFSAPEDVVRYYTARDASGFVWSGLLDVERRAFTTWSETPAQDTFFVARSYAVGSAVVSSDKPGEAVVDVKYDIEGIADAHGTMGPAESRVMVITYTLVREGARWRIAKPDATEISPVVVRAQFPLTGPAARGIARR